MRRRMNQYPSNHQQYHNPHEGYHHHNQYGGYPQQPYYQPNPQPYYDPHRQGYQNEGYYESRNPTLFYLLIVEWRAGEVSLASWWPRALVC